MRGFKIFAMIYCRIHMCIIFQCITHNHYTTTKKYSRIMNFNFHNMKNRRSTRKSKQTSKSSYVSFQEPATEPEELSIKVIIGNQWSKTYFKKPAKRTIKSILNLVDTTYKLPNNKQEVDVINWTADSPFKGRIYRHDKCLSDLAQGTDKKVVTIRLEWENCVKYNLEVSVRSTSIRVYLNELRAFSKVDELC